MSKVRFLVPFKDRKPRRATGCCDARIIISDEIVMVEYANGMDLVLKNSHPRAIELLENIKLPK